MISLRELNDLHKAYCESAAVMEEHLYCPDFEQWKAASDEHWREYQAAKKQREEELSRFRRSGEMARKNMIRAARPRNGQSVKVDRPIDYASGRAF